MRTRKRRVAVCAGLLTLIFFGLWIGLRKEIGIGFTLLRNEGAGTLVARFSGWVRQGAPWVSTKVVFPTAPPEEHGIDPDKLDELRQHLAERNTEAFLVVRDGHLVHEWYRPGRGAYSRHGLASLAKAAVAGPVLAAVLGDGYLDLDDRVGDYVPAWREEPQKREITVRHLATHSSGLENISFAEAQSGWRQTYIDNPEARFGLALDSSIVLYEPGTRYHYSGVGYYVLAYVIARSLPPALQEDIRSLYTERVLEPIGIPVGAWRISYNQPVTQDGLELYVIGSGASFTPRAVAAIGQLVLNRGAWHDEQVIPEEYVDLIMSPAESPAARDLTPGEPLATPGWWSNQDNFWPTLPPDAVVGAGVGHELLLIVPSLQIVVVRLGRTLARPRVWGGAYWTQLEQYLFAPLMESIQP